jgi:DsbC/DsbD-like thiol-disulfide interchange protein
MRDAKVQRIKIAAVILLCGSGSPVWAQDASPWEGELHAATRLIAGASVKSTGAKVARAGIEIRLDPGWKTYWRYPGDSGVPPTINFAGSENVKSVTALWPAPERFADGAGGHSIGYVGDIVLPLRIVPDDASKPSSLRLKLDYAVCGKLCVPAQAELGLTLFGNAGAEEPALVAAEARVPRHVALGAAAGPPSGGAASADLRTGTSAGLGGGLGIASVHREATGGHERVVVVVSAPDGAAVDLFVEGPTPDWALPLPEQASPTADDGPGKRRFTFDLDGVPPGAHAEGAMLTLTAVSSTGAIEVEARLD